MVACNSFVLLMDVGLKTVSAPAAYCGHVGAVGVCSVVRAVFRGSMIRMQADCV